MIDFYDVGAGLLRDEPPRFEALQSVIDRVNARLARRVGDPFYVALPPTEESASKMRRRIRFMRGVQGATDQPSARKLAPNSVTQADALALFSTPPTRREPPAPVGMGRNFVPAVPPAGGLPAGFLLPARRLPVGGPQAGLPLPPGLPPNQKPQTGLGERITGPEFLRLVTQAGPEVRDGHALQPSAILPQDARPQLLLPRSPGGGVQTPGAAVPTPKRGVPSRGIKTQNITPPANALTDVWRRIKVPSQAEPVSFATGASGARVISAIVTATLAAQQAHNGSQPAPEFGARGHKIPGATPDAPVYTRMVPDHPAVPVHVANADALTSATIDTLARHQSAMPTAPTGLNNNLVPPAPGVAAPGSYHP
ncbi:hypothetical protein [Acidocella sp.]|jgi:hypothetical protein|uniref:hypothetical protein n=1 Tax=Acidocella sp. TaxID=50710 RepID=UPI002F3F8FB1